MAIPRSLPSDDVELIDELLDAGADIEHPLKARQEHFLPSLR